jgi:hypothetical protein
MLYSAAVYARCIALQARGTVRVRCIAPLFAVTRLLNKTRCEVRCEDLIFRIQASVSHVHMISGHDRTHHLMKSKPYSHRTSQGVLLKSRVTANNGAIQRTRTVPRACSAIQLYSARVYSCAIQHTAYTLYSPIRRSSGSVPPYLSIANRMLLVL